MRRRAGERKLNYIGTSYGTIVGAVYANVFPGRVRAMALDGVVNPSGWSHPQIPRNGGRFLLRRAALQVGRRNGQDPRVPFSTCAEARTPRTARSPPGARRRRDRSSPSCWRGCPWSRRPGKRPTRSATSGTVRALYLMANWKRSGGRPAASCGSRGPAAVPPPAGRGEEQEMAIACGEVPIPAGQRVPGPRRLRATALRGGRAVLGLGL